MSENQPFKLSPKGTPFESEEAAYAFIKAEQIDRKKNSVVKYQGGWAIVDVDALAANAMNPAFAETGTPPKGETYSRVIFNQKSSSNDSPFVPLSKNGVELRIWRGKEVIVPDSFLEIADHASFTQWEPSEDRNVAMKNAGLVKRYGYTRLGAATEGEYKALLGEGNRITNEVIERMKRAAP